MSDQPLAPEGGDAIAIPAPATDAPISVRDAAKFYAEQREPKEDKPEAPKEASTPEPELAPEADAAPDADQSSGETTETPDPAVAEQSPIEPPRSWTKDEDRHRFNSLPRETQEYLVQREQERDAATRRGQNEAANERKAIETERKAVEDARKQYETALPALLQTLQEQQQGEFSDIRSMADVEALARTDFPRYAVWDAQQKKIAAVSQHVEIARQRQDQEKHSSFAKFASEQDKLFIERFPEFADAKKATELQQAAVNVLKDTGFDETELIDAYNGQKELSLRDHRVQSLIRDAVSWREAQARAQTVTKKPLPPVQKPGAAPEKGSQVRAQIEAIAKKLPNAKGMESVRLAAQLMQLRKQA